MTMALPQLRPEATAEVAPWRARLARLLEGPKVQNAILGAIVLNAAVLGLETWPAAMAAAGRWLTFLDNLLLALFVVEIAARIVAHGGRYFRDPWSLFDFSVVAIALVPAGGAFSVLRTLRVLRVMRLLSIFPRMRRVVRGLLMAIPGLGSIVAVMAIVYYVAAVIATTLFGPTFPDLFGSLGASLFSLFQIMTLEGWPDIVRQVMAVFPRAWIFFVCYMLIATFTMLNLFIAVIVNAMQTEHEREMAEGQHDDTRAILTEIGKLRAEVAGLRGSPAGHGGPT